MSNYKNGEERELFVCDCGDVAHQFVVSWYPEDEDWNDLLYFSVHLNQSYGFWKRLWNGIKHAFGYRCRFGAFDEVLLNEADVKRLMSALDCFLSKQSQCK